MKKYLVVSFILLISSITLSLGHSYHGVSMAPNTLNGWTVAQDTGLVLYTSDCGLTWDNQSFLTPRYYWDVFSLNEQKSWICGIEGFVFYTPNGGQNWYPQAMGLAYNTNKIYFINDTCGWAACDDAIIIRTLQSTDTIFNFYTWELIFLPNPPFYSGDCHISGIHFINHSCGWFCSGRMPEMHYPPDETIYTKGQGYIASSTDSGLNWQLLLRDTIDDFFDIKMLDSLHGFVIGGNDRTMSATIKKTDNGGITWQPLTIPAQAKFLRSMKIIGNKIWAVGHHGTILYSDNGGNNWTLQTCPIETTLYDIDFGDTLHGLIGGEGYILYTHNGGNTWHIANLGIEEEIGVGSGNRAMTSSIKLYPNPAKSYFSINFLQMLNQVQHDKLTVKIFDVSGKLVKEIARVRNGQRNDNDIRISLNGIKNGVYFIRIQTLSKAIIERLVVIK
jgi:photosystem II stability/assembly factor-like uncharacterized protein